MSRIGRLLDLALCAAVAASEYPTGNIRNLLVRTSSRTQLFVGAYLDSSRRSASLP